MNKKSILRLMICCVSLTALVRNVASFVGESSSPAGITQHIPGEAKENTAEYYNNELFLQWLEEAPSTQQWVRILQNLGNSYYRRTLRDRILARSPFPAETFIDLLPHEELAVRLGALELLEEYAGTSFDYDPWQSPADTINTEALLLWDDWLNNNTNSAAPGIIYSGLTNDDINRLIQDAISNQNPQRRARAIQQLSAGDKGIADRLQNFLQTTPDLSLDSQRRLQEILYRIQIPLSPFIDNITMAKRLVTGDADARAQVYTKLAVCGSSAVNMLASGLNDPNPIVREAAAEALIKIDGKESLPIITDHLQNETDHDVRYAIIRSLGKVRTRSALDLLISHFHHQQEDIVLIAIESAAKLKSSAVSKALIPCLSDERWRVRTAALTATEEIGTRSMADAVKACLDDPDEFVRYSAVKALPKVLSTDECAELLEERFLSDEQLRVPIAETFTSLEQMFPDSLVDVLLTSPPEQQIAIARLLGEDSAKYQDILMQLATGNNDDVACSALRSLAQHAKNTRETRYALIHALQSESDDRKRAVFESFIPSSDFIQKAISHYNQSTTYYAANKDDSASDMEDLFSAFLDAPEAPEASPQEPPSASSDKDLMADLFDAFIVPSGATSGEVPDRSLGELVEVFNAATQHDNPEIAQAATIAVLALAPNQIEELTPETVNTLSSLEIKSLFNSLEKIPGEEARELLISMLASPSDVTRAKAISALTEDAHAAVGLTAILEEYRNPETHIQPKDLEDYSFRQQIRKQRGTVRNWITDNLETTNRINPDARIYSIALLGAYGRRQQAAELKPLLTDTNSCIRAAAWYAYGALDRKAFINQMGKAVKDPSPLVRLSAATVFNPATIRELYFTPERKQTLDTDMFNNKSRAGRQREDVIKQLDILKTDPSPRVRLEAMLTGIANREAPPAALILETFNSIPRDQHKTVALSICETMQKHTGQLDTQYRFLVPVLKETGIPSYTAERLEKIYANKNEDDQSVAFLERTVKSDSSKTSHTNSIPLSKSLPLPVLVFYTPDCEECILVEDWLNELKEDFPGIQIQRHNILEMRAQELQEKYIEQNRADASQAGVTPFLVTAGGCLTREQLETPKFLHEHLLNAQTVLDTNWMINPARSAPLKATKKRTVASSNTEPAGKKHPWLPVILLAGIGTVLVSAILIKRYRYSAKK